MKKKHFIYLLILLLSCDKEKYFGGPNVFTDDFESYTSIDSIIDGENLKWSYFQKTVNGNSVLLDTTIFHSGGQSIKSTAATTDDNAVSKASFAKHKMAFYEGDIVVAEMWYYIEGTEDAEWLFLFDIEEQATIGAGPGMRLALVENALVVEHKYLNPNIYQAEGNEILVPRNEWFKIRFETLLHQKEKGYVKVWQNDTLIIEQQNWNTLPKDILYSQQGTKGMYTSIEFGITANGQSGNSLNVYADDISVKVLN